MRKHDFVFVSFAALTLATTQCSRAVDAVDDPIAVAAAPRKPTPTPADVAASPVRVPIDGLPVFGSARALVTIVAFTDYECPYCAKADKTITTLRAELGDDLRVVLASRPLPIHDRAAPAARALLAAAEQGKAEAMHSRLFLDANGLDDAGVTASARAIGLDMRAFESARTGPSTAAALARADALAKSLDVNGTPTFYVNGRRVLGARPYETFRTLVDEERVKALEMVAGGVAREDVYSTLMAHVPVAAPPLPAEKDDFVNDVALDGAPMRGPARAPVTIALFSDFECPYCLRVEATLRSLEAAYPGKIRVAFRQRPLPMHEHARIAAKASIAAEAQGRFWEYHDVLLTHRDALDRTSLERYARELGLDVARFGRDMDDSRTEARVTADETQAAKLHAEGTPTLFVNGRRITGAQPLPVFRAAVDRALAGNK